jgi:hypothetical protein
MSRKRDKGRISGPFVPMLKATMKEPAWIALSHGARSLYVALKGHYNSRLGNAVYLSARVAAKEMGATSKSGITRLFRELQYYGFVVMITPGHLGIEGRGKAPHWRLTEEWFAGEPPTRDYQRWDGKKFHEQKPPEYYKRQEKRLAKLVAAKQIKKQNPVQTSGTLCPDVRDTSVQTFGHPPPEVSRRQGHTAAVDCPDVRYITSLTTPTLKKRSGKHRPNEAGK